jgi:hypothetical protein
MYEALPSFLHIFSSIVLRPLKQSGYYMYHMLYIKKIALLSPNVLVCVCVSNDSENKRR